MKLLVLLAVLGAASAQYQVYTAGAPFYNAPAPLAYGAHPLTYGAHPLTYGAHPLTYAAAHPLPYLSGYPYVHGLPLSFKPAEEKAAEETPAVESRSKRSADEDQKAEDATLISTYATPASTYPLTYNAAFPYTAYQRPTVYNAGYSPLAYHGCTFGVHGCTVYNGVYPGYAAPLVHSLKKRDTSAAEEDQKAEDATYISTYAAHPLTYNAAYPYNAYNTIRAPTVYNAGLSPLAYNSFYNGYPFAYRRFY